MDFYIRNVCEDFTRRSTNVQPNVTATRIGSISAQTVSSCPYGAKARESGRFSAKNTIVRERESGLNSGLPRRPGSAGHPAWSVRRRDDGAAQVRRSPQHTARGLGDRCAWRTENGGCLMRLNRIERVRRLLLNSIENQLAKPNLKPREIASLGRLLNSLQQPPNRWAGSPQLPEQNPSTPSPAGSH